MDMCVDMCTAMCIGMYVCMCMDMRSNKISYAFASSCTKRDCSSMNGPNSALRTSDTAAGMSAIRGETLQTAQ